MDRREIGKIPENLREKERKLSSGPVIIVSEVRQLYNKSK